MKVNRRCEPERIAPGTYVIRQLFGEGLAPAAVYVNSMVIAGPEPVIVDTGPAVARDDWMADVFSIVDPADVRWVFLSHDDTDHVGNLPEVLDMCPNATLVTNMSTIQRMAADYLLPIDRARIVNDGDRFTAGDLLMTTVLGIHPEALAGDDRLTAYVERCRARPAYGRAMAAHLGDLRLEQEAA